MKKRIFLVLLLLSFSLFTGCENYSPKKLNDKDVYQMLKDKKTFILEIIQDGCSACEEFNPTWEKILKDKKIKSYYINLSNLTKKQSEQFHLKISITGTPTTIFFKKGEEETIINRIIGNQDEEDIIKKLETNDYIKKDK